MGKVDYLGDGLFKKLESLGLTKRSFTRFWRPCRSIGCGNWVRVHKWNRRDPRCEVCDGDVNLTMFGYSVEVLCKAYRTLVPGYCSGLIGEIDHIVPRWFGEQYGIPFYEFVSLDNLQFISSADNLSGKHGKGSRLPEEWFSYITGVKWVYQVGVIRDHRLWAVCEAVGVSYVKAASKLLKEATSDICVGNVRIVRLSPENGGLVGR